MIKLRLALLFLLIICSFVQSCKGENQNKITYSEKYDWKFKKFPSDVWVCAIVNQEIQNVFKHTLKTSDKGHSSAYFNDKKFTNGPISVNALKINLGQQVILPEQPLNVHNEITTSLTCSSMNLEYAWLITSCFDQNGVLLNSDSVNLLVTPKELSTFYSKISCESPYYMAIQLQARGKINKEQCFIFDQLDVSINGNSLSNMIIKEPGKMEYDKKYLTTFSELSDIKLPEDLNSAPILGIGEMAHGSATIEKSVVNLILDRVKNGNCKLVLTELPLIETLLINAYVQGFDYPVDSLRLYFDNTTYSFDEFKRLMTELRAYNNQSTNKVYLLGMDMFDPANPPYLPIHEYLYELNKAKKDTLNDLISKIRRYVIRIDTIETLLKQRHEDLVSLLGGEKQWEILEQTLKQISVFYYLDNKPAIRDEYMYKNVIRLRDIICSGNDQTLIYAHFGHLNKKNIECFNSVPNLGNLLSDSVGTQYRTICLTVGKGELSGFDMAHKYTEIKLPDYPSDNIENVLNQTDGKACYLPGHAIKSTLLKIHLYGYPLLTYSDRYAWMTSHGLDGILFFKDCEKVVERNPMMTLIERVNRSNRHIYPTRKVKKTIK